jgi:hypothetical protein
MSANAENPSPLGRKQQKKLERIFQSNPLQKHSFFETLKNNGRLTPQQATTVGVLYNAAMEVTRAGLEATTKIFAQQMTEGLKGSYNTTAAARAVRHQRAEVLLQEIVIPLMRVKGDDDVPNAETGKTHFDINADMWAALGADERVLGAFKNETMLQYSASTEPALIDLQPYLNRTMHAYSRKASVAAPYAVEAVAQKGIIEPLLSALSVHHPEVRDTAYYKEHLQPHAAASTTLEDEHAAVLASIAAASLRLGYEPNSHEFRKDVKAQHRQLHGAFRVMERALERGVSL